MVTSLELGYDTSTGSA